MTDTSLAQNDPKRTHEVCPEAARLLQRLGRGGKVRYLWIKRRDGTKETFWQLIDAPITLPDVDGADVYFGVNPTDKRGTENSRSLAAPDPDKPDSPPVAVVNCVYAEYDNKTLTDVLALLKARGVPEPSVCVFSGGGIHVYWFLTEPLRLTPENRAHVIDIQKGWNVLVGGEKGVNDLPRVLRLPGTHNHKPERAVNGKPPQVRVVLDRDNEYTFAQLEAMAAAHVPVETPQAQSVATITTPNAAPSDDVDLWKLMESARNGADVAKLKEGTWKGNYDSQSSADIALCNALAFWTGKDAGRMDRMFRQSGLMRPKWDKNARAGETYGAGTIARAIAGVGEVYEGKRAHSSTDSAPPADDGYIPAEPPAAAAVESWGPAIKCTDLGNARRLVQAHGANMRYCYLWRAWLTWDDKRWNRDDAGQAMRYAKSAVAGIYEEAGGKATEDARKEIGKWAIKSEARDRLGAMIDLAQSEPGIAVQPDQLDTDHALLNVANGTLNLRTGILQPHRPADLITKLTPIVYDATATCPLWDAFLWRIMDGRQELIDFLQRAVGYALTGDVSEQCLFYLYGKGANGKSTFLTTILAMLGKDYATQAAPELLTQGDRHPTEIADLRGLRFVATVEIEDGARMAEGLVKQMTGGDVMKARFMRGDFFQFDPTHKLFLAANHKLLIKGTDHAMWRRIRLIPFTETITDAEKDVRLPEKLRAELPGILAWAVRGCAAWYAQGLNAPSDVTAATGDYRTEMDTLGRYLEECTVKTPGATVQAKPLYLDYQAWYKASGEKEKDMLTMTAFGRALGDRGFTKAQDRTRITFYQDLGLLSTPGLLDHDGNTARE